MAKQKRKKQLNFLATEEQIRYLEELSEKYNLDKSKILRLAIDSLYLRYAGIDHWDEALGYLKNGMNEIEEMKDYLIRVIPEETYQSYIRKCFEVEKYLLEQRIKALTFSEDINNATIGSHMQFYKLKG